ncbi:MAG: DNA gyrase/topoisomerase IV subunit A [Raineya sp.]|jgi:topoisomerase-4 subunit A|nr:DNA gyrase/topoisomerase IV subunit A [Raineya sp.]
MSKELIPVNGLFENWFLDYASYVILERAIPAIEDGLKPVQRRILHSMKQIDDGRYNKVANIIGQAMQYHPHGDAAITEAMVGLGQKDLLIDTQGNWGDIRTGDSAAASRYIEARLTKFALEIAFNPSTTEWQLSYDGRKKEPIALPMKFPLLLAQGVEGIAVGLSTKILPHNFCELIEASIDILKGKTTQILPDFPIGGIMDVSDYRAGLRGGKVKVRAKIEKLDNKTLVIKEIPFSTTTTALIDSVLKAVEQGKIKIKNIVDNTAKDVEIIVNLQNGISPEVTIDALYAVTDCEVSISPNACIIINNKPVFTTVDEILRISTEHTKDLLRQELEIQKADLLEKILYSSLEKIFIENKIYRRIEEAETWEAVLQTISSGLEPYKAQFYRNLTEEDLVRLTEIKIKRISKFDAKKADEQMIAFKADLNETENNLNNLTNYAIAYFKNLLKKYAKGRERKTTIATFSTIQATQVVANNTKLYVNKADGFIGYGLKKDEFVCDCSDIDDIIVFRADGKFLVTKIAEKTFVGKEILYVGVFDKNDNRMTYNLAYRDGLAGTNYVKRFQIGGITRDREYDLTKGEPKSRVLYFTANPNGEAEKLRITLSANCSAKNKVLEYDFAELDIKGRSSMGNILTKYPIKKVEKISDGVSTLGKLKIYYDSVTGELNTQNRGLPLGHFEGEDKILLIYKDGQYEIKNYDIRRFEPTQIALIEKFNPQKTLSCIYYSGEHQQYFAKRFKIETSTQDKMFLFINEDKKSKMVLVTTTEQPQVKVTYQKPNEKLLSEFVYDLDILAELKGWKAIGNKMPIQTFKEIELVNLEPIKEKEEAQMSLFA